MKSFTKLIGIIALAAVIGFSFAVCGGGGGGGGDDNTATYTGTAGGTTYTLIITKSDARYTAQNGDAYELNAGSQKSEGTVSNVSGNTLTLKPSNANTTFTATVSGSSLTALNDTITWTDNTTADAPGALTGVTTPGTDPGPGGTLTVTDIPAKYNGKYANFSAHTLGSYIGKDVMYLSGFQNISNGISYSSISSGTVRIPAWLVNDNIERYSGNDTFEGGVTLVEVGTQAEHLKDMTKYTLGHGTFSSVTFSDGSATISWNDLTITEY